MPAVAGNGETEIVFTTHDQLQAQALSVRVVSLVDGHLVTVPVTNLFRGKSWATV